MLKELQNNIKSPGQGHVWISVLKSFNYASENATRQLPGGGTGKYPFQYCLLLTCHTLLIVQVNADFWARLHVSWRIALCSRSQCMWPRSSPRLASGTPLLSQLRIRIVYWKANSSESQGLRSRPLLSKPNSRSLRISSPSPRMRLWWAAMLINVLSHVVQKMQ